MKSSSRKITVQTSGKQPESITFHWLIRDGVLHVVQMSMFDEWCYIPFIGIEATAERMVNHCNANLLSIAETAAALRELVNRQPQTSSTK